MRGGGSGPGTLSRRSASIDSPLETNCGRRSLRSTRDTSMSRPPTGSHDRVAARQRRAGFELRTAASATGATVTATHPLSQTDDCSGGQNGQMGGVPCRRKTFARRFTTPVICGNGTEADGKEVGSPGGRAPQATPTLASQRGAWSWVPRWRSRVCSACRLCAVRPPCPGPFQRQPAAPLTRAP